jgi:hypothetical protein
MIDNPFSKKKTLSQKIFSAAESIPHPETTKDKRKKLFHQILIYVAIFIAGFVVAKVQTLLSLSS